MNKKDKEKIRRVIVHCKMFEYGFNQTYRFPIDDPISLNYDSFAGLHLISTMFLLDKGNKPMGGFCYRILEPMRLAVLLEPIREIVESPIGNTTFGNFIRNSRNKLATHGDLSFASLPVVDKKLPFSNDLVERFQYIFERLAEEVKNLENNLEKMLNEKN